MFKVQQFRDERGTASSFVMLLTVALLIGAGLVLDGGYALAARRQLSTQAEQAARIGADALNQASLRDGGVPRVDSSRARTVANRYLTSVNAPPASISINGDTVTVSLNDKHDTVFLSLIGIRSIPVAGQGSARSIDAETN